jgi:hypothetical protein
MAQQICVVLSAADREQLAMVAADRNRPRKLVERACRGQTFAPAAIAAPHQDVRNTVAEGTLW